MMPFTIGTLDGISIGKVSDDVEKIGIIIRLLLIPLHQVVPVINSRYPPVIRVCTTTSHHLETTNKLLTNNP
jgi:hypothetical protein